MKDSAHRAVAIVGLGAILPDAPDVDSFWDNIKGGRYSISDVDPTRWDPALYYDADPAATDKTYSRIGGWVRDWHWDPIGWRLPIPPKVAESMDEAQRWTISCTRAALADFGYPERPLDLDRTAVILGNAMAGEKHYLTALRVSFPEFARELEHAESFAELPTEVREKIVDQTRTRMRALIPDITEDSMPGELANCMAGRIANLFNFHGPNYVVDAACASAMAAISAAVEGLEERDFDAVITGGVDRNMGASTYVKFCKIGALSATGTRPYADGADGFVMGEGAALFMLKRLADAERDDDHIYAVLRGVGGSSDGKGKGITAPNPVGQKLAIGRAWDNAGLSPATATYIEGHGTSTRVGDVVEVESLSDVFTSAGAEPGSIGLGSVKSNVGHLKGAAGAAGLLKTVLALHDKVLPPTLNCDTPNPNIDFAHSPFVTNTALRDWEKPADGARRAGVSAFGFGGTNFHIVLEEHQPGALTNGGRYVSVPREIETTSGGGVTAAAPAPKRGAAVLGAATPGELAGRLRALKTDAEASQLPPPSAPLREDLEAAHRVAIDYGNAAELSKRIDLALRALERDDPGFWGALGAQGIFRGAGPKQKVAFLYPGQGSQYVNMLRELRETDPEARAVFAEADRVMTPHLGRPITDLIFVDPNDEGAVAEATGRLKQTEITQPAVLTVDIALHRILASYGVEPDMVMGHSLGEYGALVAGGVYGLQDALEAVCARGAEMTHVSVDDNGKMLAVFAPLEEIRRVLARVDGMAVIANINSRDQAVIGGASDAIDQALALFTEREIQAIPLPVSHAFHTSIVAPASEPLGKVLARLGPRSPTLPIIANVTGDFYPDGPQSADEIPDILARQVASPVQFVKGLETLYDAGARVFVEVGAKKALKGFVDSVLGDRGDVVSLFTNHPKVGELASFNQALCGLYAAGHGAGRESHKAVASAAVAAAPAEAAPAPAPAQAATTADSASLAAQQAALGQLFDEFMTRGRELLGGGGPLPAGRGAKIVVTGAALGLPGTPKVFDDANVGRILHGEQFIDVIPYRYRQAQAEKHITRLVKTGAGGPAFETIDRTADVVKLAGRAGEFDLEEEFGVAPERVAALDSTTALAVAVGIDALRDAGIPLVHHYKTATTGAKLPDRWRLPERLRDDTGIIFASAFPGVDAFAEQLGEYYDNRGDEEQLETLESLRAWLVHHDGESSPVFDEVIRRISELKDTIAKNEYQFDRRFLFRVLAMGHSQLAEEIGARGPNTQINGACASTTQAVALAEDWIRQGRCRRVIIVSSDNVTSDHLIEWVTSGFLASGAAATDEDVAEAATPFDRRRHGMITGMGAAALVLETEESAQERGLQPICEVLGAVSANSAFHGTRLDVSHIADVMEGLVSEVERRHGIDRARIASQTMFMSHETYTPARGGSASAEVEALRHVFGERADQIVVSNTKGFTGHAMGAGVEDVVAVKALETGIVPPVPNFREVDPELGNLNLSTGGSYPVQYALRLGAGFGSQIAMSMMRWLPVPDGRRRNPDQLGFEYRVADRAAWADWLRRVSGYDAPKLEVESRRLRVQDEGPPQFDVEPAAAPAGLAARAPAATAVPSTAPTMAASAASTASAPTPAEPVPAAPPRAPAAEPAAAPATPPPPPPPAAAPAAVEAAPAAADDVKSRVIGLVAEKTGYPAEMLDLDLDMEADLGVDTVKQAEVFAEIRGVYDIPRDENLQLRDFPTLEHVVQFVRDRLPEQPAATPTAPEPAVAEAAPAAAPAAPAATAAPDDVEQRVVALVAEKTGYPADMLDLDLDMEADLGVDTVKQAEVFAEIRGVYDIPRDENLQLRDFPTLEHVVQFVRDRLPDQPAAPTPAPATEPAASPSTAPPAAPAEVAAAPADDVEERVVALVADKTGYPADMLDLDLDMEADLGVDTVKQAEVFAEIRGVYDIPRDENLQLRDFPTLAHVVQFVRDRRPDQPAPAAAPEPAAPAEAEAPAPAAEPAAAAADEDAQVVETILAVVSEKTGYPPDMLDLSLDMEADLGIDTVKQAEIFAALREAYGIPRDANLQLKDFPTLNHALGFVKERRPDGGAAAEAAPAPAAEPAAEEAATIPVGDMAEADRVPRRVPVPIWRPPMDYCVPTGVELGEGARVLVMPDAGGVGDALVKRLEKLGVDVKLIEGAPEREALAAELAEWAQQGPVTGVYWLPALDAHPKITEMSFDEWREGLRVRAKLLHATLRALDDSLAEPGRFLVAATRLGGQHGYDGNGASEPMGGAVSGLVKAYSRERAETLCKVVDFETSRKTAALADRLIDETLRDPGAVEIGTTDERRWSIGLIEKPSVDDGTGMKLDGETVFLVTGAAGSIVSAIVADLANASGGHFHLLDLAPAPDREDPDVVRFRDDRPGLQRELFERLAEDGKKVTPVMVEKALAGIERSVAAADAIAAIEAAGGEARWHQVDLCDAARVAEVVEGILETRGRIDVLIHAAGLEISRFVGNKTPEEFDLVFDVKSDGFYSLMHALDGEVPGAVVAFSSVAGRFGNAGQTDYAAANDLLCKYLSRLGAARPDTLALAIDWTAWGEIGMASRGSIPTMMKAAGIDMLAPAAGIPVLRREITRGSAAHEIVVAEALGVLDSDATPAGGLDLSALPDGPVGPMLGRVVGMGPSGGLTVETELDPKSQPFLYDHQINGKTVLPGVMGLEAFAELATMLLPEWEIADIEDVRFLAPFKFYRDEPRRLRLTAQFTADGHELLARCALIGMRQLKLETEPTLTTHFTANVRLAQRPPEPVQGPRPSAPEGESVGADAVYRIYSHGPAYQVLESAWGDGPGTVIGRMAADLPPNHAPETLPLKIAPRHIELCFQTAGMHELGIEGRFGLPSRIGRVIKLKDPEATMTLYSVVRPSSGREGYDAEVVDDEGEVYLRLEQYCTSELPDAASALPIDPIRNAMRRD